MKLGYLSTIMMVLATLSHAKFNGSVQISEPIGDISQVAITSNGQYIVSGSYDNLVRVYSYDGQAIQLQQTLTDAQGLIQGVRIISNHSYIYSASKDHQLRVYFQVQKTYQLKQTITSDHELLSVDVSLDGNCIATATKGNLTEIYQFQNGIYSRIQTIDNLDYLSTAIISGNAKYVITAGKYGAIKIYSNTDGNYAPIQNIGDIKERISWVDVSHDGTYLAVSTYYQVTKSKLRIYSLSQQYALVQLLSYPYMISSLAMSGDGGYLVSGGYFFNIGYGSFISIYRRQSAQNYQLVENIKQQDNLLYSVDISDSKFFIVSGGQDHKVRIHFSCDVSYCSKCSWKDKCTLCNNKFHLSNNNTCLCTNNHNITLKGQCVSCQVNYCNHCEMDNICNNCREGFALQYNNKSCRCQGSRITNIEKMKCISCYVENCVRCDDDDKCSECETMYQIDNNFTCYIPWYIILIILIAALIAILGFILIINIIRKRLELKNYQTLVSLENQNKLK